jgi:hypothetical protein
MTIEELYALIEEECKLCEDAAQASSDEERVEWEGYVRALHWVLSVIEDAHEEEEL